VIKKQLPSNLPQKSTEDIEREFLTIKAAIQNKPEVVESLLKQRFNSPKPWKFFKADLVLVESGEIIDLVFEHSDPQDRRFILVDLSIPYLQKGQKFTLEAKAKQFQKEHGIAMSRVKKAVLLVRKMNETISVSSSRLHCPLIEVELNQFIEFPPTPDDPPKTEKPPAGFSEELLEALKGAIVQDCLATMHKRRNKYIRKGLWRWIEREIMDPNVHFFLVILSCIYQGKTSEVLSRRFKTIDDYGKNGESVIDGIFSEETGLAPEILKNAERHRRALRKFMECFGQTPPFDYLRTLFLREFRTSKDSIKARTATFDVLKELLARCGFLGEKEIQYPLEILDELGIFQGLIMGNYSQLRIENATKKLKHLVPNKDWTSEEVYKLRNELARLLNLPADEFNLNAFLPQAFIPAEVLVIKNVPKVQAAREFKPTSGRVQSSPLSPKIRPPVRDVAPEETRQAVPPIPVVPMSPMPSISPNNSADVVKVENAIVKNTDIVSHKPSSVQISQGNPSIQPESGPVKSMSPVAQPPIKNPSPPFIQPNRSFNPLRSAPQDYDESKHRHFEYFGGQLEEDSDSIQMALDMIKNLNQIKNAPVQNIEELESLQDAPPPQKRSSLARRNMVNPALEVGPSKSAQLKRGKNMNRRRGGKSSKQRNRNPSLGGPSTSQ